MDAVLSAAFESDPDGEIVIVTLTTLPGHALALNCWPPMRTLNAFGNDVAVPVVVYEFRSLPTDHGVVVDATSPEYEMVNSVSR